MVRMFGCSRSRVNHIERKKSKCNYDLPACPTEEQIRELETEVNRIIAADLPITYQDERHITIGGVSHYCTGPRTHVSSTGKIEGFHLMKDFVYDPRSHMYLLIGRVGEMSTDELDEMNHLTLA